MAYDDVGDTGLCRVREAIVKPCPALQFREEIGAEREEQRTDWGNGLDYCINPQNISNKNFHRVINNSALSVCYSGQMTFILIDTAWVWGVG